MIPALWLAASAACGLLQRRRSQCGQEGSDRIAAITAVWLLRIQSLR